MAESHDFRRLRGRLFHDYRLRVLTTTFEGVTSRVFGKTFELANSKAYAEWMRNARASWIAQAGMEEAASQTTSSVLGPSQPTSDVAGQQDLRRRSASSDYSSDGSGPVEANSPAADDDNASQGSEEGYDSDGSGPVVYVPSAANDVGARQAGHRRRAGGALSCAKGVGFNM